MIVTPPVLPILNLTVASPQQETLQPLFNRCVSSLEVEKTIELFSPSVAGKTGTERICTSSDEFVEGQQVQSQSTPEDSDEENTNFMQLSQHNLAFAKAREMRRFKEKCGRSLRPWYDAFQLDRENWISVKDLQATEEAVADCIALNSSDEMVSLHTALGLTVFPDSSYLQGVAFTLNISPQAIWTFEQLSQWIPKQPTDSDFWQIGEIFISYDKRDLAQQWLIQGKEKGISSATLDKLMQQMKRIEREKEQALEMSRMADPKMSQILTLLEHCYSSIPPQEERAQAVIETALKTKRSFAIWGRVCEELNQIAQGSAWVLCRLRRKQASVVFDVEPSHQRFSCK